MHQTLNPTIQAQNKHKLRTRKNPKNKTRANLPHAAAVLERVGPALERAVEVAVHLVLLLPALVHQRELEQRAHVRALAGERDEHRHVGGVVLWIFAVGVEVDGPLVASDGEVVARDVLPDAHALGQRVALDHELVRPVHRLRHRPRARRRHQRALLRRHGSSIGSACSLSLSLSL